ARYLWRPHRDGQPRRFASWAAMREALPALTTDARAGAIASHLYGVVSQQLVRHTNHTLIEDGDAYRELYKSRGHHQQVLRYWHDKLKTTRFTVRDMAQVSAPQ